jgi:5-methyltetrahydrofolate--homocysteine methyltransferase
LRGKRLAGLKFRRQHVVGNYIADFVCLPARLIIEIDGDTHGDDEAAITDAKRTAEMERSGYRVIRFWDPTSSTTPREAFTMQSLKP